jgi:hypothetical protein
MRVPASPRSGSRTSTRRIEGCRQPGPEGYAESRVFQPISVQAFPEVVFTVRELLG